MTETTPQTTSDERDREALATLERQIAAAFAAGDADQVAALYTEDAVLMPPMRASIVGRQAIAAHYRPLLERFQVEIEQRIEETVVAGDWAFQRGTLVQKVSAGGRPAGPGATAKYLLVARREADGVWRVARDVFNANQPPRRPGLFSRLLSIFTR